MPNDRSPLGLGERFAAACVSFFFGAMALNWGARLLDEVWMELVIIFGLVGLGVAGVLVYRWRRDRW